MPTHAIKIDIVVRGSGFQPLPPASRGNKLRDDPRLPDREQIVGIEMSNAQKAYPITLLRQQSVVNDRCRRFTRIAHSLTQRHYDGILAPGPRALADVSDDEVGKL